MSKKPQEDNIDDKDLPGYPHYPAHEDITRSENNSGQVNFVEENITLPQQGITADTTILPTGDDDMISSTTPGKIEENDDDDIKIVMGTEADVTADDLALLGDGDDLNIMRGELDELDEDGEYLNEASGVNDMGSDLDVPGSEADDDNESIGAEDEENNYYSLGGDDKDQPTE